MRKSIALFSCLVLLGTGAAHAQNSHTTSTPGAGIMPGNGSSISNGPEGDYDNTLAGSTTPIGTSATKSQKGHRHTHANPLDNPDTETGNPTNANSDGTSGRY